MGVLPVEREIVRDQGREGWAGQDGLQGRG
jgi:hypothetical protein